MINTHPCVSDYDYITKCIESLRLEVYGQDFYKKFFDALDKKIPLFNYKYEQYTLYITIDQNKCKMIDGFKHDKFFYSKYIDSTFDTVIRRYINNITVKDILNTLNSKGIPTYKLISYTPILSNQIVIYF